jgi:hypothetical protein
MPNDLSVGCIAKTSGQRRPVPLRVSSPATVMSRSLASRRQTDSTDWPPRSSAARTQAASASSDQYHRSSVRHHWTSSRSPGSTPPWRIAAARSANLLLWCWALELERRLTAGAGDADRVGGEAEQQLAGERVVRWVQWRQAGRDVAQIVAAGETVQRSLDRLMPVIIGRSAPSRHADHATSRASGGSRGCDRERKPRM